MNRALVAVLVVASAGPACKTRSPKDREVVVKVIGFSNQMCQCKDKACAETVMREMQRWGEDMAKNADREAKPDPKVAEHVSQAMSDYTRCMSNLLVGKPTTHGVATSADADVLIAAALAEAKQAPLAELTVAYAKSDATLDATYGKLTVRSGKRPPQDPADDPNRPIGAPVPPAPPPTVDVDCWTFEVEKGKQERETFPCLRGELAQPHCTVREVWKRAIAAGAPSNALATVTLVAAAEHAPQHWLLAIEDAPRNVHFLHEVIDDCPPVLEKQ